MFTTIVDSACVDGLELSKEVSVSDNVVPTQTGELEQQKSSIRDAIKRILAIDAVALIVALTLLVIVFSFTSPYFFNSRNFMNIGRSVSIMGITATGVS